MGFGGKATAWGQLGKERQEHTWLRRGYWCWLSGASLGAMRVKEEGVHRLAQVTAYGVGLVRQVDWSPGVSTQATTAPLTLLGRGSTEPRAQHHFSFMLGYRVRLHGLVGGGGGISLLCLRSLTP